MRLKIPMRCHFAVEHSSPMSPKRMVDGKDVFHQVQTDINSSIKLLVRWLSSCSLDGQFSSGQGSRVRYYSSTVIQTSKRRKVKRVLKCKTHVWFVFCLLSNLAFQNCFTSTTRPKDSRLTFELFKTVKSIYQTADWRKLSSLFIHNVELKFNVLSWGLTLMIKWEGKSAPQKNNIPFDNIFLLVNLR